MHKQWFNGHNPLEHRWNFLNYIFLFLLFFKIHDVVISPINVNGRLICGGKPALSF